MPAEPKFSAPDPREVDPCTVRRAFSRAASTYDEAAVLEREVASRMAQRLDYIKLAPLGVLDAGCGTGEAIGELAARYPAARIVGLDVAEPMVAAASERTQIGRTLLRRLLGPVLRGPAGLAPWFVCGDANAIPLRGAAWIGR